MNFRYKYSSLCCLKLKMIRDNMHYAIAEAFINQLIINLFDYVHAVRWETRKAFTQVWGMGCEWSCVSWRIHCYIQQGQRWKENCLSIRTIPFSAKIWFSKAQGSTKVQEFLLHLKGKYLIIYAVSKPFLMYKKNIFIKHCSSLWSYNNLFLIHIIFKRINLFQV